MEERKRGQTQPWVGWISRFAFLPWLSASCVCVSGDTTLISLCGKTTAELQSWRLPLNRRWSPSNLHLALDTAAFHKMTLRELSAFIYPTLNLKLGCDFTSNCTEMQWLQWVVCSFFCWSTCWQNHDKNKQLVPVKSQGQTQTAYFVHKWFNVTGHGESRRSVRKNKQERKYYFRIAHPK